MTDLRSCSTGGLPHRWQDKGSGRGFCLNCGASEHEGKLPHAADMHDAIYGGARARATDQSVDWGRPLEPGPAKIDAPGDERKLCEQDAQQLGVGYMIDGKRVHPSRVTVFVLKPGGDND